MSAVRKMVAVVVPVALVSVSGCAARNVDLSSIERPARAAELEAYDVFVGSWAWQADMVNAEASGKSWTGEAEWRWTLDNRTLSGTISAQSGDTRFESAGVWSWHPKSRKYIWWMFNNWGYPQQGTAKYDSAAKSWRMDYKSVGLDGTTSYGRYRMTVVDSDTLDWTMDEWADALHLIKKMEMTGRYTRK